MPYPNLAGKHAYDALVTPQDLHASFRAEGVPADLSGVRGAVLCYRNRILDRIVANGGARQIRGVPGECFLVDTLPDGTDRAGGADGPDIAQIAVCGRFGIGAPAATIVLEGLIALGIRRVVSFGTAGCLQRGVAIGDLVLCTEAIRDEGVSHHYLPPEVPARPTAALTERLREALAAAGPDVALHAGPSWTIDAIFRETVEEARHYQALGIQTVEMEASALFAVAAHRGVEIASAFVISDSLADLVWNPRFHDPAVDRGLDTLYAAARAALLGAG